MSDNSAIEKWVQLALTNEEFAEYSVEFHGKTGKNDGYVSNINFVTVNGKTNSGEIKSLPLVIKASKDSASLREQIPVKEASEKEIYIYDRVFKEFDKLQKEMGVKNLLDFMPKCYATSTAGGLELLILENLRSEGYCLSDRMEPLSEDHVRIILQSYGRWHAFSLALKKEKPGVFESLIENNINVYTFWVLKVEMVDIILEVYEKARNSSKIPVNDLNMLKISKDDVKKVFVDFFNEDIADQVILHGDCWINNYMFKEEETTGKPTDVRLLDWQLSGLSSPVNDLSAFIYDCCDTSNFRNVEEFLKIYHSSLSECLTYLGCDSNDIFPYEKLLYHWNKFSLYGLIVSTFVLKFSLCDTEDAPDFQESAEKGKSFIDTFNFSLSDEDRYHNRVRNNFLHYIENLKN